MKGYRSSCLSLNISLNSFKLWGGRSPAGGCMQKLQAPKISQCWTFWGCFGDRGFPYLCMPYIELVYVSTSILAPEMFSEVIT